MAGTFDGAMRAAARRLNLSPELYAHRLATGHLWCTAHQRFCARDDFAKERSRPNGYRSSCRAGQAMLTANRRDRLREEGRL